MERTTPLASLLGESPAMQRVRAEIRMLGAVDADVLIQGEAGTGKRLVARAIHAESRRRDGPFVSATEGALAEVLFAGHWFGHPSGAPASADTALLGWFEAARGGSLFVDEIGHLSFSKQGILLRVLEERAIARIGESTSRPVDVRLLAATERDLDTDVAEGRFRRDLFYRLRVGRIVLPPLRQRPGDIPVLALAFARRAAAAHGKPIDAISREAMAWLGAHRWPGNVRELASIVEGAVVRAADRTLRSVDLLPDLRREEIVSRRGAPTELERERLLEALQHAGGNRSLAARTLGISRSTLYRRLASLARHDRAS